MASRRRFIKQSLLGTVALSLPMVTSCASSTTAPKISLAQWSLNRAIRNGDIKAADFASITRNTYGFEAVEYVNSFYKDQKSNKAFWNEMKDKANGEGVNSLLIMIDEEGDLGDADESNRLNAVDNHKLWVDIASELGCHSIRVNAFGDTDRNTIKSALIDGLGMLCDYGAEAKVNIVIENHGLYSSDAAFVIEVIEAIDHPYMGTLPDFGNWCTAEKWGGTRDDSCGTVYDQVKGVKEFMPYAKGVSAKTYDFNSEGGQDRIDYKQILQVVKDFGYNGYIGIEYEGEELSEPAGIRATEKLIKETWQGLD